MTPFGIRKRIKAALGLGSPKAEIVRFPITYVLPDGTEQVVQAEERYTVLMASQGLASPISTGRRAGGTCPDGYCDLCRVEVIDARGLSEMTDYEQKVMADHTAGMPHEGRPRAAAPAPGPNTRLACHARIIGPGATVKVAALVDFEALRGEEDGW
ncbi:MAG: hypothetical protein AAFV53_38500 [Myxococcota bacterium]